eukprot:TRINITY_DN1916_c0_g1_i3.p1 TRINITY_DN1916_c0_g1~~TRINITY_DN1916_c0_g1_i3.p1  ORF type:complete len:296 (+),score=58.51 TRINITY_DN1916_c0_g1_i3:59-889(+)
MSKGLFGFNEKPQKARFVVQKDLFDDATACKECGYAGTLAYTCNKCEEVYCDKCVGYERHTACKGADVRQTVQSIVPSFVICEFKDCTEKNMVKIPCGGCGANYCSTHRGEYAHSCPKAKLAPMFNKDLQKTVKKDKTPDLIMPPNLHVDDRRKIIVTIPPTHLPSAHRNPVSAIVHKKWGTGKAVDFLLSSLSIPRDRVFTFLNLSTLKPLSKIASFTELSSSGKLGPSDALVLVEQAWLDVSASELHKIPVCAEDKAWTGFTSDFERKVVAAEC